MEKNIDNTIVNLKGLLLIAIYLKQGPQEVL